MRKIHLLLVNIVISTQILYTVLSKNTGDKCDVQKIFNDVTILGGMRAGLYIPYQGSDGLATMTATKCTVYCCKKAGAVIDVVFMINKYCYCISCYSSKLCQPVPIKPPRGFSPVAIILNKDILHLVRPSLPVEVPTKTPATPTPYTTRSTSEHVSSSPTDSPIATSHVWYESTRLRRTDEGQGRWQTTTDQVTLPHTPVPTTLQKTLGPTRIAEKQTSVKSRGNENMALKCNGKLTVTEVAAFGVPGDQKAVADFNKYCQANMSKVDGTNVCYVSLKRIYKSNYPPFVVTKVIYNCKYTTREPA